MCESLKVKLKLVELGISQLQLVNYFMNTGSFSNKDTLISNINYALNGKRTSKAYSDLLLSIEDVLDKYTKGTITL